MRRIISLLFIIVCASAAAVVPAKPERHVVVVVWDGMRPDFVTEQTTPTLWKLARESYGEGVRYTIIYEANKEQISNPDLIYPGQVFAVPTGN